MPKKKRNKKNNNTETKDIIITTQNNNNNNEEMEETIYSGDTRECSHDQCTNRMNGMYIYNKQFINGHLLNTNHHKCLMENKNQTNLDKIECHGCKRAIMNRYKSNSSDEQYGILVSNDTPPNTYTGSFTLIREIERQKLFKDDPNISPLYPLLKELIDKETGIQIVGSWSFQLHENVFKILEKKKRLDGTYYKVKISHSKDWISHTNLSKKHLEKIKYQIKLKN
ncbi:hypothetical protein DFA_02053 [Cavenderia fasciculata]|uniref:Uncharacterized protein n=1 Tax=Cavenderia fasciculata TaxID=261658 RepID=F4PYK1_CACFS|nr:uncharacterized protein DFA_02053 [Cavenderia fasciculata]EGG19267.1 hypothetical protein DFA_02053 [Cavenderia fasciculata]|eukprot:XP_004357538.1 hypothetical protein DFA_02053 [Cavenderia fasciculata]